MRHLREDMEGKGKSQEEIKVAVAELHIKVAGEYQRAGAYPPPTRRRHLRYRLQYRTTPPPLPVTLRSWATGR